MSVWVILTLCLLWGLFSSLGLSHRMRVVVDLVFCWDLPGRPALFWGETGRGDAEQKEEVGKEYGGVEKGQAVRRCTV